MTQTEVVNNSVVVAQQTLEQIGTIGKWLQAIGVIAVILIISAIVSWWYNSKKWKLLRKIERDLDRIEKRLIGWGRGGVSF